MASEISSQNEIESPFAMKWTIAEEKLAALKDSKIGYYCEKFEASNIPDLKYFLSIYPNGNNGERHGQAWIFLELEFGNEKKIQAAFKFIIDSAGFSKELNYVYKESIGWGEKFFCTTSELFDPEKKFFVDGKLILKCEGNLTVEKEKMSRKRKWKETTLGHHLWKGQNKDFTIMVDGRSVQVHKCVLADRSPVFQALFNSEMKEVSENKMEITDFSFECVEVAIELLYDRNVQSLTVKEKTAVLQFLDKYEILDLKELIEASLMDEISTSTVCYIANASLISNSTKLQEKCMDFIVDCNQKKIFLKDFDDLDSDFANNVFKNTFYKIIET